MEKTYTVLAKFSGEQVEYIKAREDCTLMEPEIGERYWCCHVITSPVVSFYETPAGYIVNTKNSTYRCFVASLNDIDYLASANNLPQMFKHDSAALYWGHDTREKEVYNGLWKQPN